MVYTPKEKILVEPDDFSWPAGTRSGPRYHANNVNLYGFSQAIEVSSARRLLFCAGQIALDAEGKVTCVDDMRGQIEAAMNNVETVLAAGGLSLANVVRLNFYTTDMDGLVAHYDVIKSRLAAVGCQPSSTLLGVKRLAFPELLIEIEATAAE